MHLLAQRYEQLCCSRKKPRPRDPAKHGATRSQGTAQVSTLAERVSMIATEVSLSDVLEWFCLVAAGA